MAKVPNAVEIAENYNRLSTVHERYRQTDRQTDDRRTGDSSSRSLKMNFTTPCFWKLSCYINT